MSQKNHRAGGKFGGGHTTVTDFAGEVADFLAKQHEVTSVNPGFIKKGGGKQRVIVTEGPSFLVVKVISGGSSQELKISTNNFARTKKALEKKFN